MSKHLCNKCGKIAQWIYIPSGEKYWCDDCISSPDDIGCSCNSHFANINAEPEIPEGIEGVDWRWVNKEEGEWQKLDEKGRPYPCCEYDFSESFDIEVKLFLTKEQKESIKDIPQECDWCKCDIFLKNGTILKDEWVVKKEYIYIIEDLNITNKDILQIKKAEK